MTIDQQIDPRNFEIYDFMEKVLRISSFPLFTNNRNRCKTDRPKFTRNRWNATLGTASKNDKSETYRKYLKTDIKSCFLVRTHFEHQERTMELRGVSPKHFRPIFNRFIFFGNLNATKPKHKQIRSKKKSKSQGARPTNDNLFNNKANCPGAVAGLGEALWI